MKALGKYECKGQMSIFDLLGQDSWSGKMSQEHSAQIKERISNVSLKKQQKSSIKMPLFLDLRGGRWTPSGCILGDGWSIAWRVHDAQFWGVPQRRKRISLVADFGGQSAPEVLFERKSMSRDSEEGKHQREKITRNIGTGLDKTSYTLKIRGGVEVDSKGNKAGKGPLVQTELSATLGVSQDQTLITTVYGICSDNSNSMKSTNPYSGIYKADTSRTLDLNGGSPACNQGGMAIVHSMGHDIRSAKFTEDEITDPLTATDYKDPIKVSVTNIKTYQKITGCLDCGITKGTGNQLAAQDMFIANSSIVRKLTPLECERLQGYPDGWTNIKDWTDSKGKQHKDADSPRYKALGNSIALPFWEWLADRMVQHLNVEHPTMASLFDGIGGFPLVFSRCGCSPIWASEIEEFPIAVTKIRFPDNKKEAADEPEQTEE